MMRFIRPHVAAKRTALLRTLESIERDEQRLNPHDSHRLAALGRRVEALRKEVAASSRAYKGDCRE